MCRKACFLALFLLVAAQAPAREVVVLTYSGAIGTMSAEYIARGSGEAEARQAKITVAEGEKQAAILQAEGERQAAILRADGYALALDKIFSVARNLDVNTMSLQCLETLKTLGHSPATKFIFPMEFAGSLKSFAGVVPSAGSQAK